ncbi:calcium homeostasis modulator protein 6 isoform X1 [Nycticebus coucang]|uniref:calcium homeostasis modulator protein 6 isoform X1 n=1 Tax=Nycticebus coucang TaxID=9470 RepID=UPI00234E0673|nr:calcium homeostasis modulator protein 6 isoform X1 [Nycticebus coucang]
MDKFPWVLNLHFKHRKGLGVGLVTLLTVGGERIFSATVFQCPCTAAWNLSYSLAFMLVPALALLLLGFLLNARLWFMLTGCCRSEVSSISASKLHVVRECLEVTAAALLTPLVWVAVALLGGAFYECGASGIAALAGHLCSGRHQNCTTQLPLVPCGKATEPDVQDLLKELKAQSQVLGWILIAVVITIFMIFTCIFRCLSPVSFPQWKFWKIYREEEQKVLKSQTTEHATELAKENVKCFFASSRSEGYKMPSSEEWQKISSIYTCNPKKSYYSILHKYVNRKERNDSISSSGEDAVSPSHRFVDSSV